MTIKTGLPCCQILLPTVVAFDKNNIVVANEDDDSGASIGEQNADGIPLPDTDYVATATARADFVVTVEG